MLALEAKGAKKTKSQAPAAGWWYFLNANFSRNLALVSGLLSVKSERRQNSVTTWRGLSVDLMGNAECLDGAAHAAGAEHRDGVEVTCNFSLVLRTQVALRTCASLLYEK